MEQGEIQSGEAWKMEEGMGEWGGIQMLGIALADSQQGNNDLSPTNKYKELNSVSNLHEQSNRFLEPLERHITLPTPHF